MRPFRGVVCRKHPRLTEVISHQPSFLLTQFCETLQPNPAVHDPACSAKIQAYQFNLQYLSSLGQTLSQKFAFAIGDFPS
jgi:hypothetical protein